MAEPNAADSVVIPRGARVLGCIETTGAVLISGDVDGDVRAGSITIDKTGSAAGVLVAAEMTVSGKITDGDIFADKVVLGPGSDVTGEIYYRDLDIRPDSYFEGKTRRHEAPRSLAPAMEDEAG